MLQVLLRSVLLLSSLRLPIKLLLVLLNEFFPSLILSSHFCFEFLQQSGELDSHLIVLRKQFLEAILRLPVLRHQLVVSPFNFVPFQEHLVCEFRLVLLCLPLVKDLLIQAGHHHLVSDAVFDAVLLHCGEV